MIPEYEIGLFKWFPQYKLLVLEVEGSHGHNHMGGIKIVGRTKTLFFARNATFNDYAIDAVTDLGYDDGCYCYIAADIETGSQYHAVLAIVP